MALIASAAAVTAAGLSAGAVFSMQKKQMDEMRRMAEQQSSKAASLEARADALEHTAHEFTALPKMMSLKRREAEQTFAQKSQEHFAHFEKKHQEKEERISNLKEKLDHVPKLFSDNRRQLEAFSRRQDAKDEHIDKLHAQLQEDVPSLQSQISELECRVVEMAQIFDTKTDELSCQCHVIAEAVESKAGELNAQCQIISETVSKQAGELNAQCQIISETVSKQASELNAQCQRISENVSQQASGMSTRCDQLAAKGDKSDSDHKARADALEAKVADLQKQLASMSSQMHQMQQQLAQNGIAEPKKSGGCFGGLIKAN